VGGASRQWWDLRRARAGLLALVVLGTLGARSAGAQTDSPFSGTPTCENTVWSDTQLRIRWCRFDSGAVIISLRPTGTILAFALPGGSLQYSDEGRAILFSVPADSEEVVLTRVIDSFGGVILRPNDGVYRLSWSLGGESGTCSNARQWVGETSYLAGSNSIRGAIAIGARLILPDNSVCSIIGSERVDRR
jgi:hypothetical protein